MTIAQRQERTRLQIIDALRHHKDMSARQIAYELSVYGIWLSPAKLAHFIRGDKHLQNRVRVEVKSVKGQQTLVYSLKDHWGRD